ncbi:aminoacyl-tRNA hydrolase [Anaerovorax odorimutans]|uniref:aminoacyl-tRNA hydrolase n=1 Tax=Anaerovorax odorimutans TaxID=109327 RepID=UPI000415D5F9|nr:aminoacyl-tRNA hydrolase [Anaerovorax odorimutans]
MYVIVGLGNPGRKYENTKHNIGFITIDYLAEKNDIKINKIKHKALVGEGFISGHKVLLVKPQTYMNLSGNSVREIVEYYKINMEDLIVIYDDIDIELGRLRIRKKGSAGTHNGMKSIIYDIQSDQFPRVRIGIGNQGKMDLANYVIGKFHPDSIKTMQEAVKKAALSIECIIEKGIDKAMNEYNVKQMVEGKKVNHE